MIWTNQSATLWTLIYIKSARDYILTSIIFDSTQMPLMYFQVLVSWWCITPYFLIFGALIGWLHQGSTLRNLASSKKSLPEFRPGSNLKYVGAKCISVHIRIKKAAKFLTIARGSYQLEFNLKQFNNISWWCIQFNW